MKVVAALFLALLLDVHLQDRRGETLDRPLSMFRDDGRMTQGYLLFALLLMVGVVMIARTVRLRRLGQAAYFLFAGFLLVVVMLTPSLDGTHELCALALLGLLYFFYLGLLWAHGHYLLLWLHGSIPLVMLGIVRFHSYGLWQKGIIAYFVLAVVLHHHFLERLNFSALLDWPARGGKTGYLGRERRVYSLEPGKAWARREPAST